MPMLSIDEIIKKLWDAQGYGNLAVWGDGTMKVIAPGTEPGGSAGTPSVIFKPIALIAQYPMLDHALGDAALRQRIGDELKAAGIETE
jgi:hypothetical protein